MKLLRLRIKNLNSFRTEIELDFESAPLCDSSLIAITGPTGAGKTTLLDALCVALYNKTPRLSGVGNQNPGNLLSQGKTEGFAEVLFEAKGRRYVVEWRIKRGSQGALKSEVKLVDGESGDLITDRLSSRGVSHGTSSMVVSEAVESILGLDFAAFNRSVMLAQGDFAAFLRAKPEERRKILEATTGIGIYDELKQMLNKKVEESEQAYDQVVGMLETIPSVTNEEIEAARRELDGLEHSAASLQSKRREILQNRETEGHRSRLFAQLTSAEARQEELLSRQVTIDTLRSQLQLARRAVKLFPERDKFESQKGECELIEAQMKKTHGLLDGALAAREESQESFRQVDQAYHRALSTRKMKIASYDEARVEEIHADAQSQAAEKREMELVMIQERVEALLSTATSQEDDKSVLVEGLECDRLFLQQHAMPYDGNQRVNQLTGILEKLNAKSDFLTDKLQAQRQLKLKIAQLKNLLTVSEGELKKRSEAKAAADATVLELESVVKVQRNESPIEVWEAQRLQAVRLQAVAKEFEQVQGLLHEKRAELDLILDDLASVEAELGAIVPGLMVQIEIVKGMEQKVKRYTVERDLARALNHVNDLRGQLREGESCPVCGAVAHPWVGRLEDENQEQLEIVLSSLSLAECELDAQKQKCQRMQQDRVRNEENQSNLQSRSHDVRSKNESLQNTIDAVSRQWAEVYSHREISSAWTEGIIDAADEAIQECQNSLSLLTGALNEGKMALQRFNEQEREFQRTKTELQDSESSGRAVSLEVEGLIEEVAVLKTQFWGLLPHNLRTTGFVNALHCFTRQVKLVEARQAQLVEREKELNQLEREIGQNQRILEAQRDIRLNVESEIGHYRVKARQLSAAAQKKTGGLPAADAVGQLEANVAEKTRLRVQVDNELRERENFLTQAQTKRDDFELQHTKCLEKVDALERNYLRALEDSGFESSESHVEAFRDEAWVEARSEELAEYQQQLQITEEVLRELRLVFVNQPFDSELVLRLEETGKAIDLEVESTNQRIGYMRESIRKLEEDFRRREALANVLETSRQERDRWAQLQTCIPHNRLRDFALERMFELIIRLANTQLEVLTQRYALGVNGIDGMVVIDRWNANEERPVETLSGGEAFLTSLSLALALSEVSRGRTQLNSLYLDEGFGTLDSHTLDVAISALEALRIAGRSVSVISHVTELTRRIPVRIAVEKLGNGSSRVQVQG